MFAAESVVTMADRSLKGAGEVSVGDQILGRDAKPQKVISVHRAKKSVWCLFFRKTSTVLYVTDEQLVSNGSITRAVVTMIPGHDVFHLPSAVSVPLESMDKMVTPKSCISIATDDPEVGFFVNGFLVHGHVVEQPTPVDAADVLLSGPPDEEGTCVIEPKGEFDVEDES